MLDTLHTIRVKTGGMIAVIDTTRIDVQEITMTANGIIDALIVVAGTTVNLIAAKDQQIKTITITTIRRPTIRHHLQRTTMSWHLLINRELVECSIF